ncbi:hypothetical protein D3C77_548620 [compost metagenome]
MGGDRIRLLDKAFDFVALAIQGLAFLDVAKAGFGVTWHQAECGQPAFASEGASFGDSAFKRWEITDQVVSRQYQQLRAFTVQLGAMQGCGGNCRGGVTAERLEDKVECDAAMVQLAVFILGAEIDFPVGHGQNPFDIRQGAGASEGLLQQALAVGQAHKGLGHGFAGNRPKSSAGAAGDDARD